MEIDWKYDDIKAEIKIGDIVTFKSNDGYRAGVVGDICYAFANVFTDGKVYTVGFSKIIARASFDDVVRPAKPKFPDGALTWDEVKRVYNEDNRAVFVKFNYGSTYWPAIIDCCPDGYVIVWCAGDKSKWLREDGYGKDYVCYLNKPDGD